MTATLPVSGAQSTTEPDLKQTLQAHVAKRWQGSGRPFRTARESYEDRLLPPLQHQPFHRLVLEVRAKTHTMFVRWDSRQPTLSSSHLGPPRSHRPLVRPLGCHPRAASPSPPTKPAAGKDSTKKKKQKKKSSLYGDVHNPYGNGVRVSTKKNKHGKGGYGNGVGVSDGSGKAVQSCDEPAHTVPCLCVCVRPAAAFCDPGNGVTLTRCWQLYLARIQGSRPNDPGLPPPQRSTGRMRSANVTLVTVSDCHILLRQLLNMADCRASMCFEHAGIRTITGMPGNGGTTLGVSREAHWRSSEHARRHQWLPGRAQPR